MTTEARLLCPCGAAAPEGVPRPGSPPVPCTRCGTPLVGPGRVAGTALEWGLAAGFVAGTAAAYGWMLVPRLAGPADEHGWTAVARALEGGAPWTICVGALAVAWSVRLAARARSPGLQWIAVLAFAAFLCAGEVLLYRNGVRARLVGMHAAEGVADPEFRADEELQTMTFLKYLHLEIGLAWFAAVALGTWIQAFVLRPFPAVAAFAEATAPQPEPDASPAGETGAVAEAAPPASAS